MEVTILTRRIRDITELYGETLKEISKSPDEWLSFMECAAMNYKYSFSDQALIYAQKPETVACAEIETWNRSFKRWVNKGATGIALLTEKNGYPFLRYVFDVSDTNSRLGKNFLLWTVTKAYEENVIEALENRYGELENKTSLATAIISSAYNMVEDNLPDYLEDLKQFSDNSMLGSQDDNHIKATYQTLLSNSVAFMMMKRCGIDPTEYFKADDFKDIQEFNTYDTITRLGVATSDISEMGLREIYATIKNVRKNEIDKIRTFDKEKQIDYDISENRNIESERSEEYERNNLHNAGRLQDTRPNATTEREKRGQWEIRIDEVKIPKRPQESIIHDTSNERPVDGTPIRDTGTSRNESGTISITDDETRKRDGRIETTRPNEMGGLDEQLEDISRGDSNERTNLQLGVFDKDSSNCPYVVIDAKVNQILSFANLKVTNEEIKNYFETEKDRIKRAEYLKNAFDNVYVGIFIETELYGYKAFDNGLLIWKGNFLSRDTESFISWEDLTDHYNSMILLHQLYDRKQKLPTEKEQLSLLDLNEKQERPELEFSQEFIDTFFQEQNPERKFYIYRQLQSSLSTNENITFLKNLYGLSGSTHTVKGSGVGFDSSSKGITLYRGYEADEIEILLKWNNIEKRLKELIKLDRYLNPKEMEYYPKWLEEHENSQKAEYEDTLEQEEKNDTEIIEENVDYIEEYEYHLGDKVYIGADEYEIISFDDNTVRLYDYQYPLFNQEFSREEFDRKVQENPANDHLKVRKLKQEEQTSPNEYGEFNDEVDLVEHILHQHKIFDIKVNFNSDEEIVGYDDENEWVGEELYDFLFNQLFEYNDDGTVKLVDKNDIERLKEYQKKYEVVEKQKEELDDLIGEHLTIDNRKFIVDSINNDRVSLKDITFQGTTGFPIFRDESIDYVKELLAEKEKAEFVPAFEKKKKSRITTFDLHPEIKNEDRNNFHITDDMLGVGTDREKFNRNIAAIKVLKLCEKENRFATPEEQKVLSQYVGWGGLPQAFDDKNSSWSSEYLELKNLLDEDEYKSAMESTLTAFYTPPVVIRTMYKALEQMGMKTANILEPACGTGNFIGMLPVTLNECKLYGVELDKISGKIAQQLYQKSSIAVQGFENTVLPDSFFDGCIGNVPFGDFKLLDKKYDKNNFLIHDYFFAKAIDKVRPGGVIAFITSKGTLDKESPAVRKYIAQRADLLGAIRLPDNTFKANAGTKVTSDIIFLQKRDSITDLEPEWVHLDTNEDGIKMNKYFIDHPEMICGNMVMESTQFGMDSTCKANEDTTLEEQLNNAIQNIHAEIKEYEFDDIGEDEEDLSIPADVNVRNFSYTLVDNKIYYRENSRMYPQELPLTTQNRIKGLIEIRDCVRTLIELQTEDYPDEEIKQEQKKLNTLYDNFIKKYGLINSRANTSAFSNDNSFYLLCSLEILDENKELKSKADMFTKRTIKPNIQITKVDTAQEALVVSISEKARVDLDYMQQLCGIDMDKMLEDLEGQIFNVPIYGDPNVWVTADEYLSGNVREKLKIAEEFAKTDSRFETNVKHLKEVQPKDLEASEIAVRLGATWLPPEDIEEFIWYLLTPSWYVKDNVKVHYMESTAQWSIENKNYDRGNVKANSTFGTHRVNAYKIIEETLNLKDVRVYDYTIDDEGRRIPELNKKETAIAQAKQEQIKTAFEEWIWTDPERRQRLCKMYNEKFNSIRPREYDGSHIRFDGMNPEIKLRKHQINGIARILYGGNTLLAHEVGAGKTFTMVAAAMEAKRLGLCNKSMFVVPNHIVEQFSSEFLQLYPSANILVTTKKDFETGNRKKFCSRIATGDYDAVIISHSQFEKIPMSVERQTQILQKQIDDIMRSITDLKENHGERFTIKQLMKTQKSLETKLKKLNDTSRKDDVVTFEELGVDRIFVDEAHYYKNLFLYTKMRNVGGIAQTEAQKSSDLFMKCRYLDELTGGKGVTFATGTPVSNSMVELYTMQRYLQYAELEKRNLQNFDAWASTFGETVTAIELAPEGTGYRAKTRFAKFYNLPELLAMFKEVADIQTSDMLNLPVPKANYENVVVKPTEIQKEMVADLADRAERVRNKMVDSSIDNMLKITNDGRKLALDQRLMNEILPDDPNSKVATCAKNIYRIWEENKDQKLTQLVFCDLSTPHNDGKFNVYDDLKKKLEEMGVPEDEVQFIHYANTDIRKKELFSKVRKGITRVLMGSTQKMGAGTNCQDKLIALHDLDCPWRPSDLIQRSGRIIRQGNNNPEVFIYRYVTEGTFDAYLYQLVENKQRFISQIMTSKTPVRSAEDIDETALSYAEIKSLASGNPLIIEKTELDTEVAKLKLLKQSHLSQIYAIEDRIIKYYPNEIKRLETKISNLKEDIELLKGNTIGKEIKFDKMIIQGKTYIDRMEAGNKILEICKGMTNPEPIELGEYKGFKTSIEFDKIGRTFNFILKNKLSYEVGLGTDPSGNITRIDNELKDIEDTLKSTIDSLEDTKVQFENAKEEAKRPFKQEQELKEKSKRLDELNIKLNMNDKEKEVIDFSDNEEVECQNYERAYAR
jgi:putative helicase